MEYYLVLLSLLQTVHVIHTSPYTLRRGTNYVVNYQPQITFMELLNFELCVCSGK